jgi:PAS domain-containing protein
MRFSNSSALTNHQQLFCKYRYRWPGRFIAANRAIVALFGPEDPAHVLATHADLFTFEHARAALRDEQEILRTRQLLANMDEKET